MNAVPKATKVTVTVTYAGDRADDVLTYAPDEGATGLVVEADTIEDDPTDVRPFLPDARVLSRPLRHTFTIRGFTRWTLIRGEVAP